MLTAACREILWEKCSRVSRAEIAERLKSIQRVSALPSIAPSTRLNAWSRLYHAKRPSKRLELHTVGTVVVVVIVVIVV